MRLRDRRGGDDAYGRAETLRTRASCSSNVQRSVTMNDLRALIQDAVYADRLASAFAHQAHRAEQAGDSVASALFLRIARSHRVQSIKLRAQAGGLGVTGWGDRLP